MVGDAVAGVMFIGWEVFIAARYGESHFIHSLLWVDGWAGEKPIFSWILALFSLLGATAPAAGLLGLLALRARGRFIAAAACAATLGFAAIPALPADPFASLGGRLPDFTAPRAELYLFLPFGMAVAGIAFSVARKILRERSQVSDANATHAFAGLDAFVLIWLAVEILGFFVLSPATSVRRVSGLSVILILAAGRLYAQSTAGSRERRPLQWLVAWGSALGLLFSIADTSDALARKRLVTETAKELVELGAEGVGNTRRIFGTVAGTGRGCQWGASSRSPDQGKTPNLFSESLDNRLRGSAVDLDQHRETRMTLHERGDIPAIKSPSQCPGIARSSISAGRSRIEMASIISPRCCVRKVECLDRRIVRLSGSGERPP